jgi:hypothetical protein
MQDHYHLHLQLVEHYHLHNSIVVYRIIIIEVLLICNKEKVVSNRKVLLKVKDYHKIDKVLKRLLNNKIKLKDVLQGKHYLLMILINIHLGQYKIQLVKHIYNQYKVQLHYVIQHLFNHKLKLIKLIINSKILLEIHKLIIIHNNSKQPIL